MIQLILHSPARLLGSSPRPDKTELGVEVGPHGPGEEGSPAVVADHVREIGGGAHVQSELEGIAVVVDAALGGEEVVPAAGVEGVVDVVGGDGAFVWGRVFLEKWLGFALVAIAVAVLCDWELTSGEVVAVVILEEAKDPELGLELREGRDCSWSTLVQGLGVNGMGLTDAGTDKTNVGNAVFDVSINASGLCFS